MKSITIHNLEDRLAKRIEQKAKESGLSLNKTIKRLLAQALGLPPAGQDHSPDFEEFLGIWSQEEFDAFQNQTAEFEKVDSTDWE